MNRQYHGLWDSRLYKIWASMKQRCYNKNHVGYPRYGARGISVCDEWKNDFVVFYKWSMKNGYSNQMSLDRIDNSLDYCPENCRWITLKEQGRNRCTNRPIVANGETRLLVEWSELTGIKENTIRQRLARGWTPEQAISTTAKTSGYHLTIKRVTGSANNTRKITVDGEKRSIADTARRYNLSYSALLHRLHRGQSPQEAVDSLLSRP